MLFYNDQDVYQKKQLETTLDERDMTTKVNMISRKASIARQTSMELGVWGHCEPLSKGF